MDRESIIMETQQLLDLGKHIILEGGKLREFVRAEKALARDEIIRIREERKEDEARIAAMEEAKRIAVMEEEERIRQHDKEVVRIQVEGDRIRYKKLVCHVR